MLKRILPNSQPVGDIPTINVKDNQDFFSNFFTDNFYLGISTSRFPTALKKTEVKPVFKNNSRTKKTNYRTSESVTSNI